MDYFKCKNSFNRPQISLNFIRLLRVAITPSATTLLKGENDSKQSDEIQAILKLALTQNIHESRGITCPFPVSSLTRVKTCLISM